MGRDDSQHRRTTPGGAAVDLLLQMPHSLQVGKMPSVEPEVGSSSTTPANSMGDVLKSKTIYDDESIVPTVELTPTTLGTGIVLESEDDVGGDDLEDVDTVPEVLKQIPGPADEAGGVGSNYKASQEITLCHFSPKSFTHFFRKLFTFEKDLWTWKTNLIKHLSRFFYKINL